MASPRASSKLRKPRSSENLTSLSKEVLRIHLQALNLSTIGRKAVLVRRLKAATHPRKGITPRPSKTQAVTELTPVIVLQGEPHLHTMNSWNLRPFQAPEAAISGEDSEEEPVKTYFGWGLRGDNALHREFLYPCSARHYREHRAILCGSRTSKLFHLGESPFPRRRTSLQWHRALASRNSNSSGHGSSLTQEVGGQDLTRWVHWFQSLLPDSPAQPQVPELQLRLDDSSPGSHSSPLSMVRKRKPVIDTFRKWLDAYTTYKLLIVAVYLRRSM